VDQAYQEVLLTVRNKLSQLRVVDAFESWFWRLEMSVAKKYRPRYAWHARSIRGEPQPSEQPRQIGTRTIVVAGNPQIARIFESHGPQEQSTPRRPLFKPLSEEIIAKASMANRLNYPRRIDVRRALAKLPKRWARVIYLIYFGGYSRTEAAKIMGCSRARIFKLTQKAKNRLRELLPSYDHNGLATLQSQFCKANRRARITPAIDISGRMS
jgi:RNA polymerase sigma factor (sigma-70 family)